MRERGFAVSRRIAIFAIKVWLVQPKRTTSRQTNRKQTKKTHMKKILLTMAVLLTVGAIAVPAAPNHRHRHTVVKVDMDSTSQAIEAYSDTTSLADDAAYVGDDADDDAQGGDTVVIKTPIDDLGDMLKALCGFGGLGIFVCILFFLTVLLVTVVPLVLVFLLVRYLMRQHKTLPENFRSSYVPKRPAAENKVLPEDYTASRMWQRGVHNVAVGVGLMLLFFFLGATPLIGIGALVACMGAGKMYIGRYCRHDNYDTTYRNGAANENGSLERGDCSRDDNDRYTDPDAPASDALGSGENKKDDNDAANDGVK